MKSRYLVCYDITDEKRLGKVFRFLKGRGLHLQYSVFLCKLTWPELGEVKERLSTLINPKEDDIRIYPLPADGKVTVMGQGDRVPDGVEAHI